MMIELAIWGVRLHDFYRKCVLDLFPATRRRIRKEMWSLVCRGPAPLWKRKRMEELRWQMGEAVVPSLRFGMRSAREYRERLKALNKITAEILTSLNSGV